MCYAVCVCMSVLSTLWLPRCPYSRSSLLHWHEIMQQVLPANRKSGMWRPTLWQEMGCIWLGTSEFNTHINTQAHMLYQFSGTLCLCQCSGVCGEGRMMRAVSCKSSGGVVMSEEQCNQTLRPLAIYPCGDRDCAPHWVEQEWQQVNSNRSLSTRMSPFFVHTVTFITILVLSCVWILLNYLIFFFGLILMQWPDEY